MFRLLGKERINNRMSLAIILKSALTFLHRRNPESARWPASGPASGPVCAAFAPVYSRGRETAGLGRKTPSKKLHVTLETKPKRLQGRKKRKAEGGGRGPESRLLLGSIGFFFLKKKKTTNSGFRNMQVVCTEIHLRLQGFRGGEESSASRPPPPPCKTGLYHSTCAFQDILPKES